MSIDETSRFISTGVEVGPLVSNLDMEGLDLDERKNLIRWLIIKQRKENAKIKELTDSDYHDLLMDNYRYRSIRLEADEEAMNTYPNLVPEDTETLESVVPYYSMRPLKFEMYVRRLLSVKTKKKSKGHDGIFLIGKEEWALEVKSGTAGKITLNTVNKFKGDMDSSGHTRGLIVTTYVGNPTGPASTEMKATNITGNYYIEIRHVSDLITPRGVQVEA